MSESNTHCKTCLTLLGERIYHNESGCYLSETLRCQRCYCRGHMSEHCDKSTAHWTRPTTLEELIPVPIREKWGITTQTHFQSSKARDEHTIHELNAINEITIPSDYGELLRFVEQNGIKVEKSTKASIDACNKAIISWAARKGMRVVVQFAKIA